MAYETAFGGGATAGAAANRSQPAIAGGDQHFGQNTKPAATEAEYGEMAQDTGDKLAMPARRPARLDLVRPPPQTTNLSDLPARAAARQSDRPSERHHAWNR